MSAAASLAQGRRWKAWEIAILVALGLEQWRAFHWRVALERTYVRYVRYLERNIILNSGGNERPGGGYWNRYEDKPGAGYRQPRAASSPISAARPNRPELQELGKREPRPMPSDYKRPAPDATAANWKGQSGYAGARNRDSMSAEERIAAAQPGYAKPASAQARPGARDSAKPAPKVQGSYAGAKGDRAKPAAVPATRDLPQPKPQTRDLSKQGKPQGDRGYSKPEVKPAARPQQSDRPSSKPMPSSRPAQTGNRSAVSGAQGGKADRAASQRGKQSLPQGARSKGGGGGGKKQKR